MEFLLSSNHSVTQCLNRAKKHSCIWRQCSTKFGFYRHINGTQTVPHWQLWHLMFKNRFFNLTESFLPVRMHLSQNDCAKCFNWLRCSKPICSKKNIRFQLVSRVSAHPLLIHWLIHWLLVLRPLNCSMHRFFVSDINMNVMFSENCITTES